MMIKELFIDRKEHLEQLTHGLKHGKDFVLIAPRRYGKTTLAEKILKDIQQDSHYLILHIDMMRYSGSVQSVAEGIIEHCLNALGFMGKLKLWLQQMEFSFKVSVKYGDLEIEPLLQLARDRNDEWLLLEQSLELIEKIALKTNKKLIVFFDEFGELHDLGERVIKIFRSVIQLHKKTNYLLAGSQETLMTKIFVEKSGAFYRFGDLIFLKEFERQEVIVLLTEMKLSYNVIEILLRKFNCHPYYTAKIIKDLMITPHYGHSMESFIGYLDNVLIHQESGYLELQLQKIKQRSNALDIMISLSMEMDPYNNPKLSRQTIHAVLKNLDDSGFISKTERATYVVADPLLASYLSC